MTNQLPGPSEGSAVPVTTATSKKSTQGTIHPISILKVSEGGKTHERDAEEGIASPEVPPLAQGFSPSRFKIPSRLHRRPRIHISRSGCMETVELLLFGVAFAMLLIFCLIAGAVFISALAPLGILIMILGAMIFRPSSYVPSDKHVSLIGAVGASTSALGCIVVVVPLGLIMFSEQDALTGALVLFVLTLMACGPIGTAIVHHFGFELQMSVGQAMILSASGFFIIVIGVSVIGFALYSYFRFRKS